MVDRSSSSSSYKSARQQPDGVVEENVTRFLNSYYADEDNRYHSLPRYFGGTLRRDRERSYKRSKSIVQSSSGTALNAAVEGDVHRSTSMRENKQNDVVRELKNYLTNSYKYNSIHSYPSAYERRSSRHHDDSGSEISSHSYKSAKHYDNNYEYNDVDDDFVLDKSSTTSKKSKFFRTSSIRSLKKFVSKLRGKKVPNNNVVAQPHHSHHSHRHQQPQQAPGKIVSYNHQQDRNSTGIVVGESGINTPSDSTSWNNGQAQPSSSSGYPPAEISTPALCGIVNHGNTCYINAVVQCLSNADVLAEYFLTKTYYPDLCHNQKNAEKYGSHGNITNGLAKFITSLWFKNYTPKLSEQFQNIVEQYAEQYRGGQQQDAQEFFLWLLDHVHEDLNIAVKRRYKLNKPRNKSEDEIAASAMEKHLEAHNSFISYHFHGLYLSAVTCPVCYKQSTTADPFACVSLPVSQRTKKPLYVVMVYLNRKPRLHCFGLNADITATFKEVKHCLAKATELNMEQLILCEFNNYGFAQSFADEHDITSLTSTKTIYAFETPPIFSSTYHTEVGEELICLICNQVGEGTVGRKFGTPVALKVHREVSYGDLCRSILLSIRAQLRANLSVQDIPHGVIKLRVVDDYHLLAYIPEDVAMPMYSQAVDNSLASQAKDAGPVHIKIMVEWQRDTKDRFFNPVEETIVDHKSAQDLKSQELVPDSQSLSACLEDFTKDESLSSWFCHDCRRDRERAVKRTVFYWLPNILTLHLKRNKQLPNGTLVKLDPLVKFPIYGLDLSEFMHQPSPGTPRRSRPTNGYRVKRNGELYVETRTSRCVYDLFAVCNHHGDSPNSGHYTAYCRNPVNGNWYCFDDQHVSRTDESHLVTNAAYMLFYERRLLRSANSCHNSTESGFVDHWYFKVFWSQFDQQQQQTSAGSRGSRDTLEGLDSGHSTNGSSNPRESPERPNSRQMFVALPPPTTPKDHRDPPTSVQQYHHHREDSNNAPPPVRKDPPVARLISIDLPPPTSQEHDRRRDFDDRKSSSSAFQSHNYNGHHGNGDYVNQNFHRNTTNSNPSTAVPKTNFVRQQSYVRRISTNSMVETDL